ncbi:DUF2052 domain-containing protein [Aphelenchoides besseyi]|nr:DUF2052 domain-containing protein [Aphelenchoides besseyi]
MNVHDLDFAGSSNSIKERLLDSLLSQPNLFIRSQQRGESDLNDAEKRSILSELLENKPSVFLQRYHSLIQRGWLIPCERCLSSTSEFLDCFPSDSERCEPYVRLIRDRPAQHADRDFAIRNRRFMAMQKLKQNGTYFSLEKMRERAPMHFDLMVGGQLLDSEKIHLRPTVEVRQGGEFSNLLEQFDDSQRISDRRKRHLEQYENFMKTDTTDRFMSHVSRRTEVDDEEFEMEFDSDDDEGRAAEAKRKKMLTSSRYTVDKEVPTQYEILDTNELPKSDNVEEETTRQMSELTVEENSQEMNSDEQSTEIPHDALMSEFQSFMETRFLSGDDDQFVNYSEIDNEDPDEIIRWKAQDAEDAYFADVDD